MTPTQNQTGGSTTTLSYCYDSVNRLISKAYTNQSCPMSSPVATYTYSGSSCLGQASCYNVGRRTGMTDAAGSESWAYDAMGRVEAQSRTTNSITKTTLFTYNLDSSIATMTYPSGRVVTYTPDSAGRPSILKDNTTNTYYATGTCSNGISGNGVCYTPQGEIAQIQTGPAVVSTHIFNNRLQPCWMYATTGTALATSHLCGDTATAGNMLDLKYNFNSGTDNGMVSSITNNRVTDRSQSFTYDQLNRVSSAKTTATYSTNPADCWGQSFGFDIGGNWGNLLSISGFSTAYNGCVQGNLSESVTTNNQLNGSGETYDAAGNLWTISGAAAATYLYNAENQMTSAATISGTTTYLYDGDGNRVEKMGSKIYWYAEGEVTDETDATGSTTNNSFSEYFYFGGERIARRGSTDNVLYYMADHLGTARVIAKVLSGQNTATMCYDGDMEPYGGEHAYTSTCVQNYKFTGKERDPESGLDNFAARYNSSGTGRFMSPDPVYLELRRLIDPQLLNLYSYVRNNPLNLTDPTGLDISCTGDQCRSYLAALQKDVSFKVTYDKSGKVIADVEKDAKLSKSDKAFLKAINDTKHHVTINAVSGEKDSSVFFGASHGATHTINFDQAALLDGPKNAGGLTSAQLAGHETLEGYEESKGNSLSDSHDYANSLGFPGLDPGRITGLYGDAKTGIAYGFTQQFQVHGTSTTENIRIQFATPIPTASIQSGMKAAGYPVSVEKAQ